METVWGLWVHVSRADPGDPGALKTLNNRDLEFGGLEFEGLGV